MRSKPVFLVIMIFAVTLVSFSVTNNNQKATDYFNLPGPVDFNKSMFNLSWSSHPNNDYYKQEYLPAGEKSETFTKMIMVEALVGDASLADIVSGKTKELDARKSSDAVTNYSIIKNPNTGEYLLDFVISQPASGKQPLIVEWNAYRYMALKDHSGSKGIMLFAYSRRSYGNATTNFLKALKSERQRDVNVLAGYKIPSIKIKGT